MASCPWFRAGCAREKIDTEEADEFRSLENSESLSVITLSSSMTEFSRPSVCLCALVIRFLRSSMCFCVLGSGFSRSRWPLSVSSIFGFS